MAITLVSATEFSTWLRPTAALALLEDLNFHKAALVVFQGLITGEIGSAAETLTFEGRSSHRARLPVTLWNGWPEDFNPHFWVTGDFSRQIPRPRGNGDNGPLEVLGVRFEPSGIEGLSPRMRIAPAEDRTGRPSGRRAGTNGEPIARAVKRLLSLPPRELAAYKVERLAAEIAEEYRALGLNPPHLDNGRRDARGVLRALRDGSEI